MVFSRQLSFLLSTAIASLMLCSVFTATGCKPSKKKASDETEAFQPAAPDPLTLLVIGDDQIGEKIARQWAARKDGKLSVESMPLAKWEASGYAIDQKFDVIIYPPGLVGELAHAKKILRISREIWGDDAIQKSSFLNHYRRTLVRFGNEPYGVPLGNPHWCLFYQERFKADGKKFPQTWADLENSLKDGERTSGKLDMPMAEGWAAASFLARVAPNVRQRGSYSSIFDRKTMKPLLETAPFLNALEQLKRIVSKRSTLLQPKQVTELALSGKSLVAMSWPSRGFEAATNENPDQEGSTKSPSQTPNQVSISIAELPGSKNLFVSKKGIWKERLKAEEMRVDTIGFSGLIGSVVATTNRENSAWQFIQWVSDRRIGPITTHECPLVGPYRASHLGDLQPWIGDRVTLDMIDEYANVVSATHDRSVALIFPRIPGHAKYLKALDRAVRKVMQGSASPAEAMASTAKAWETITESLGRSAQIKAMRKESGF